jgi:hypothetical protein
VNFLKVLIAGAIALLLAVSAASAAWYMKMEGVDGTFIVESFNFRGGKAFSAPAGKGPGSVVMRISRGGEGFEQLKQWHSRRTVIPEVILSNGKRGSAYLEYRFYDALVTRFQLPSAGSEVAIEEIGFVYKTIDFEY